MLPLCLQSFELCHYFCFDKDSSWETEHVLAYKTTVCCPNHVASIEAKLALSKMIISVGGFFHARVIISYGSHSLRLCMYTLLKVNKHIVIIA